MNVTLAVTRVIRVALLSAAITTFVASMANAQAATPRASSTKEAAVPWSVRMSRAAMQRNPVIHEKWDYTAGLMLLAIDRVGRANKDTMFASYVRRNMDRMIGDDGSIRTYRTEDFNLDQINQGRLLFSLYAETKAPKYKTAIETLRAQLKQQPRTSDGGFWHKKIYPQQMWLDGLYMAEPFYVTYARTFNDTAAFTDATKQFLLLALHARDPQTGLYYHAWDAAHTQPWADSATGLSKNFWGRAVGWYLMSAMDVLDELPLTHPNRAPLLETIEDLASAVARVQDPTTGLWFQVMDQPNRTGNYREASASSMFAYAFAKGARKGYLPARYRQLATRAFDGLVRDHVKTGADGLPSLTGVCSVAGLGGNSKRDGSFAYYISEPVVADDYKGVGPFIMAALELGR
ncbi:MAG: glycoside hydrolase family 88 protein [Gemmatimonadaceae bacterium]